jgi:nucleoside-diphosphate-sugar epimerase
MMKEMKESYAGKHILITGSTGYLATSLLDMLKDANCRIVRLSRPGTIFAPVDGAAQIENLAKDIRERSTWERALEGVDIVFHFAAQTSVYAAGENPLDDLDINVLPMLHLLETCRQKAWRPTVLFSGTVTEAGIPTTLPVDETHPDNPITIYDLHKLVAENYLKYYVRQGIVHGAVLRLANVYGPGPKSSSADRGILNKMVQMALNGEPLTVYGTGVHLRDYIYVKDVVLAFLKAGISIDRLNGQHFVIGSGQGHTIAEAISLVAGRVALETGQRVPVVHIEPPTPQSPIETRDFIADTTRFQQATGWSPQVSLAQGIDLTIEVLLQT